MKLPELKINIIEGKIKISHGKIHYDELQEILVGDIPFVPKNNSTKESKRTQTNKGKKYINRTESIRKWIREKYRLEAIFKIKDVIKAFPTFHDNPRQVIDAIQPLIADDTIMQLKQDTFKVVR